MKHIVLIEDHFEISLLIKAILEEQGYRVSDFSNGAKAIQYFEKNLDQIDLVITDILMPVNDGFDVISDLKRRDFEGKIMVITGGGIALSAEAAIRAVEAMADMTIAKPIQKNDLIDAVASLLGDAPSA